MAQMWTTKHLFVTVWELTTWEGKLDDDDGGGGGGGGGGGRLVDGN